MRKRRPTLISGKGLLLTAVALIALKYYVVVVGALSILFLLSLLRGE
jgi:hypothetical protein